MDAEDSALKDLNSAEKEALISRQPLFCLIGEEKIKKLAELFKEQHVSPGEIITEQGAIIDKVYLIASGTAEVHKTISNLTGKRIISVALLKSGDAIGLSGIGMYSSTKVRLAEVKASTAMVLIAIELTDLYQFFNYPGSPYPALRKSIEAILMTQFINLTHFFGHLDEAEMEDIAHGVQKIHLKKEDILFHEGDEAETCYFILSGKIHIFTQVKDIKKELAILEPPAFFGEAAFVQSGKRNASAVAETDCELFELSKTQTEELNTNKQLKKLLNEHTLAQLRPIRAEQVVLHNQQEKEQEALLAKGANSLIISQLELAIWQEINGFHTLAKITQHLKSSFPDLTQENLYPILKKLEKNGFIVIRNKNLPWYKRLF